MCPNCYVKLVRSWKIKIEDVCQRIILCILLIIDVASLYVLIMWITNCNGTFVCGSWTRPWFTFGAIITIGANYPRWTSFSPIKVWISWAGLHFDGNVFTRTIAVNYVGLGPILAIAQSIRIFLCLIKLLSNLICLSKRTILWKFCLSVAMHIIIPGGNTFEI